MTQVLACSQLAFPSLFIFETGSLFVAMVILELTV